VWHVGYFCSEGTETEFVFEINHTAKEHNSGWHVFTFSGIFKVYSFASVFIVSI
jgi:hypothetical protein